MRMSPTSTRHDRIKGSDSSFPSRKLDQYQPIPQVARFSASRFWVGYIMTTAEVHKLFHRGRGDDLRHAQHLRKVFPTGSVVKNQ